VSLRPEPVLYDGDVVLRCQQVSAGDAVSFLVDHQGRAAGTVKVRQTGSGNGVLSWTVWPDHRGQGVGRRAMALLIRYAFDELGLHRVVAYIDPQDEASLRTAGRAGLRREGLVRASEETEDKGSDNHGAQRQDRVQLARLATDPEPTSRDGFIGVLNAGLPTKRLIAQGLIRNNANEILLCELTYKQEWDLPGGVVDPHESPAQAVNREIREELHVDVLAQSLAAVNWLPRWRGWDDAVLFVFDLGVDDQVIARAQLEPRELRSLHWCTREQIAEHAAPYLTRMLSSLEHLSEATAYLEDGTEPSRRAW
jgi:RimJ/RimL family protein N-acetyltransferase/ADP-ribose pyrophosphatase YjhB (NUDIX family)